MSEAPPPLVIDRYRLYDEVGTGGMARVHLAKLRGAVGFARVVAVKRLHPHLAAEPSMRTMFVDEARLSARIDHANVVRTLDVLEHEGAVALVMEYVLGESLSRILREAAAPVPADVAVTIVGDVLRGLHAAHEARDADGRALGIVHRDVSPKNILVGTDGLARLIDFGVAKATRRLTVTETGNTKGTRAYMAPEQLAGETVSREADVYAAALVLREMLGEAVPPTLVEPIARALADRPRDRFPTAAAFAEALARAAPPAARDGVARWVDDVAGDLLAIAAERLARVEQTAEEPVAVAASLPAPPALPPARRPARRRWPLVALPALFALLLGGVVAIRSRPAALPLPPAPLVLEATSPPPVAAPEPPASSMVPTAPASTPAKRTAAPARHPAARPSCHPPYKLDEAGHKIFDPRCF